MLCQRSHLTQRTMKVKTMNEILILEHKKSQELDTWRLGIGDEFGKLASGIIGELIEMAENSFGGSEKTSSPSISTTFKKADSERQAEELSRLSGELLDLKRSYDARGHKLNLAKSESDSVALEAQELSDKLEILSAFRPALEKLLAESGEQVDASRIHELLRPIQDAM